MSNRNYYETDLDLQKEKEVVAILQKKWNCEFTKLGDIKYKLDFLIKKNDGAYAFAELKCRNMVFGKGRLMISFNKIVAAKQYFDIQKTPFILIFKTLDGIYYHKWDFSKEYEFCLGGRITKRDDYDIEPIYYIEDADCKKIHDFSPIVNNFQP